MKKEIALKKREEIQALQDLLIYNADGVNIEGDGNSIVHSDNFPLKHTFADGLYIREIFMPKGQVITTGIHKQEHPYFVLKGDVSVLTEDGVIRIKAPHQGITKPGTKRLIYIHEDTTWITVHATEKDNIEEVLEDILAKDFNDPDINLKALQQKLQLKNK